LSAAVIFAGCPLYLLGNDFLLGDKQNEIRDWQKGIDTMLGLQVFGGY